MANIFDMADEWTDSGTTYTAIKMDVTDTASNAASLFLDLQLGGVSRFKVDKNGYTSAEQLINRQNRWAITPDNAVFGNVNQRIGLCAVGAATAFAGDVFLYRDAADTLALRRSTNAQEFRVYNNYDGGTTDEYLGLKWDTNEMFIRSSVNGGSATARSMYLWGPWDYGNNGVLGIGLVPGSTAASIDGSIRFYFNGASHGSQNHIAIGAYSGAFGRAMHISSSVTLMFGGNYAVSAYKGSVGLKYSTTKTLAVTDAQAGIGKLVAAGYQENVNVIGSIGGGTQDIDLDLGSVVTATVDTSTTTFTFSNPAASGTASSFTLVLTNGGSQTVNWPASVDWAGGSAPTLTSSGVDVLTFTTTDGGTTWYGFAAGINMS